MLLSCFDLNERCTISPYISARGVRKGAHLPVKCHVVQIWRGAVRQDVPDTLVVGRVFKLECCGRKNNVRAAKIEWRES